MNTEPADEQAPPVGAPAALNLAWRVFAVLFGLLLGLSLLKFGNPVMMEKYVEVPANGWELLLNGWPASWGHWLLGAVALAGLICMFHSRNAGSGDPAYRTGDSAAEGCVPAHLRNDSLRRRLQTGARWRTKLPWWLVLLPLIWLAWQFVSATQSINPTQSLAVCAHFTTCVVCFYLGLLALGRCPGLGWFSLGLIAGFVLVLASGISQHFGGLEATRKYFFQYVYLYPDKMSNLPPGLLKKMSSTRIFATLFYPNTLAGAILLLLPVVLGVIGTARRQLTAGARGLLMGIITAGALGCLYWSGSKGGWLLMLGTGFVAVMFLPLARNLKLALVVALVVVGLAGFFWKYAGFFQKGATSVVARFDYWEAAGRTFQEHPVFGSGPGTFGPAYAKIKRPESEMALVAHNDYLEQASDSGAVGCLAFAGFMAGAMLFAGRRLGGDWLKIAVWLGLLGWALQGLVEFGLYIPGIAWPGFALLGWLLAQACGYGGRGGAPASGPASFRSLRPSAGPEAGVPRQAQAEACGYAGQMLQMKSTPGRRPVRVWHPI
jgi:O-antigen ligase